MPFRYRGMVTLWNDPDDAESFVYRASIKRTRIKAAKPKVPQRRSTAPDPAPAAPSCNPNYSGACLQLTGDVDCGEISARDFRSTGSDPFRLDGDGDGIACES